MSSADSVQNACTGALLSGLTFFAIQFLALLIGKLRNVMAFYVVHLHCLVIMFKFCYCGSLVNCVLDIIQLLIGISTVYII